MPRRLPFQTQGKSAQAQAIRWTVPNSQPVHHAMSLSMAHLHIQAQRASSDATDLWPVLQSSVLHTPRSIGSLFPVDTEVACIRGDFTPWAYAPDWIKPLNMQAGSWHEQWLYARVYVCTCLKADLCGEVDAKMMDVDDVGTAWRSRLICFVSAASKTNNMLRGSGLPTFDLDAAADTCSGAAAGQAVNDAVAFKNRPLHTYVRHVHAVYIRHAMLVRLMRNTV